MTTNFSKWIQFEDESEKNVHFSVEFQRDGIGSYEFWGQKCMDVGQWNIEAITFDEDGLDSVEVAFIEDLIESNKLDDEAWESIEE